METRLASLDSVRGERSGGRGIQRGGGWDWWRPYWAQRVELSYNPNASSFTPGGGGAPPFRPGQPYNPYAQQPQQPGQPQPGQQQQGQGQGQYYDQYQQQQQGGYGGYQNQYQPPQSGYGGQYGGYNPQSGYGQQPQYDYAPEPEAPAPFVNPTIPFKNPTIPFKNPTIPFKNPTIPFKREADPDAPAPAKAPTMSLNIGGGGAAKPASVSLSIGGNKKKEETTPVGSKVTTPSSSKPSTPAPGEKAKLAPVPAAAAKEKEEKREEKVVKKAQVNKDEPKEETKTSADLLAEVKAAADEDTLLDLYGKDDEAIKAMKPHLNVVFIGHVDAGKSTMGGNILYLCGMVDKRTLEKYEKEAKEAGRESWYLSWALDSTSQEREKGKTVEVGRAYFETEKRRYTILDAPGHKNFVPSMITGASQADIAVLVISARKGEFETGFEKGGQTREHAMLVKTAGVNKLIVVVNKMDDPTVMWDKARYDEIVGKLSPFLKGTGYNLKTDVAFIPISGFTGANLKENVDKSVAPWVEGDSLLNYLDGMALLDRKNNAPLMMPISEKYADMGTVVVGKVESGMIKKGQSLLLMPNKTPVTVTAIHNEMEEEVQLAGCGDNVRVRLRGVEDEDILIGFVLTSVNAPVHTVQQFEAQLVILDHKNIICAGYSAVMHVHTAAEEVSITALLHYYDKKTGKKSRRPPQFAKKGQKVIALLETAAPVCVERFADHPQLGRFTLRDEGKTIGIGKITKLLTSAEDMPDVAQLSIDNAA
ncbi:peptide chain release factor subunit 3, partial [Phenoliferia sp. Uapishka_3]